MDADRVWSAIAAFLSGVMIDVLSTIVFHYTSKNRAVAAATVNTVVYAGILYVFVDVSKDNFLAIPYLVGIWIGGVIGIWMKQAMEK